MPLGGIRIPPSRRMAVSNRSAGAGRDRQRRALHRSVVGRFDRPSQPLSRVRFPRRRRRGGCRSCVSTRSIPASARGHARGGRLGTALEVGERAVVLLEGDAVVSAVAVRGADGLHVLARAAESLPWKIEPPSSKRLPATGLRPDGARTSRVVLNPGAQAVILEDGEHQTLAVRDHGPQERLLYARFCPLAPLLAVPPKKYEYPSGVARGGRGIRCRSGDGRRSATGGDVDVGDRIRAPRVRRARDARAAVRERVPVRLASPHPVHPCRRLISRATSAESRWLRRSQPS